MNKEEIQKALEIIREPITVNCIDYHYFDYENYSKLINVYENCLWFINNFEKIQYCPYDDKCGELYDCSKEEYETMTQSNMKLSLENQQLKEENEKLNHYKLLYQKVKERNDKAIEYIDNCLDNEYQLEPDYAPNEYVVNILSKTWDILEDNNEE